MRFFNIFTCLLFSGPSLCATAQITCIANQQATSYMGWDNQSPADVSAAKALNFPAVSAKLNRTGLLEYVRTYFGYGLFAKDFHHCKQLPKHVIYVILVCNYIMYLSQVSLILSPYILLYFLLNILKLYT